MVLKLGDWKLNAAGVEGKLTISSIDAQGGLTGMLEFPTVKGSIVGFWDDPARTISFSPQLEMGAQAHLPLSSFKGFLFSTPAEPELGQDIRWSLAGFFSIQESMTPLGPLKANVRRNTFGWLAEIVEVVG